LKDNDPLNPVAEPLNPVAEPPVAVKQTWLPDIKWHTDAIGLTKAFPKGVWDSAAEIDNEGKEYYPAEKSLEKAAQGGTGVIGWMKSFFGSGKEAEAGPKPNPLYVNNSGVVHPLRYKHVKQAIIDLVARNMHAKYIFANAKNPSGAPGVCKEGKREMFFAQPGVRFLTLSRPGPDDIPVLLGYAVVQVANGYSHCWEFQIQSMEQNRGLGSTMMRTLEEEIKKIKSEVQILDVQKGNDAAMRFYKRLGYQLCAENAESQTYAKILGQEENVVQEDVVSGDVVPEKTASLESREPLVAKNTVGKVHGQP